MSPTEIPTYPVGCRDLLRDRPKRASIRVLRIGYHRFFGIVKHLTELKIDDEASVARQPRDVLLQSVGNINPLRMG